MPSLLALIMLLITHVEPREDELTGPLNSIQIVLYANGASGK